MTKKTWATIFKVVAMILVVGAVLTLIPYSGASKPSVLGYKSVCSFAPVSSVMMFFGAYTLMGIRKKTFLP